MEIKVKWSRYRPGVTQRVGRGIALLFHDRGTRRGWVVSSTPWPHFMPGKNPVPILQEAGWASGPVWRGGKSRPHRDSIPDRPARSQSLYRLSYRAHQMGIVWINGPNPCLVCEWSRIRHEVSEFNNLPSMSVVRNWKKTEPKHRTSIYFGRLGCNTVKYGIWAWMLGGTTAFIFYIEEGVSRFFRNVRAQRPDYNLKLRHPRCVCNNKLRII